MPDAPRTAAERMREYRRRQREKLVLARAELPPSLVKSLVASGILANADVSDQKLRGAALVTIARRWLRGIARRTRDNSAGQGRG